MDNNIKMINTKSFTTLRQQVHRDKNYPTLSFITQDENNRSNMTV